MNPEFLREGFALEDFLKPDRIVIGEYDKKSGDALEKLYGKINAPLLRMNLRTAEMVKYASNAFRPAKISLINEIGNICKKLDIDVYDVANALGRDNVIGPRFLNAGIGFGGSCFTKDTAALISSARELGCDTKMLAGILDVNKKQRLLLVDMLKSRAGSLKGKKIALLGLAFKPGTDDVRDAPALEIIEKLKDAGCGISAYDPKAADNMKKIYPGVKYCSSAGEALRDADACLLLTEWPEFTRLTDRDFSVMRKKIIIEGRKVLDPKKVSGFEGVCW
jgi:UDPglucose 6-dehydrogenase